jgi:hypothetical protein
MQTKAKLKKNMNPPVSFILLRKLEVLLPLFFVSDNYDKRGKNGILNKAWTILEINLDECMQPNSIKH